MTTSTRSRPGTRTSSRAEIEVVNDRPTVTNVLVGSVGVLCLLGLVMVYSASSVASVHAGASSWSVVLRQSGYMALGVALAVLAARIPLRVWRDRLTVPVLLVGAALQALLALDVLLRMLGIADLPYAMTVNGATRWIEIGPVSGQPSDIVKLGMVLWLARFLDQRHRQIGSRELLTPILVVVGTLAAFVMAGDDLGTTLLLGTVMLSMLFIAGVPLGQLAAIAGGGISLAVMSLFVLEGFRLRRIAAFLSPETHAATEGYQLLQSQVGLAAGGVFGNGPGNSRAKWGYLPEAHTDFILAVIGEELGLVGSLVVLAAFCCFMGAGIRVAVSATTRFGRSVAVGITTWIGVQALVNIGVTVGTLPTKGITLPFVSYGGSSLVMCLVAVGVLISVVRDR